MKNDEEDRIIQALDDKELSAFFLPAIKEILKSGGGAEAILKRSEPLAAMKLLQSMDSPKDEVRLKAALSVLDRTLGRPVERHLSIYADVAQMSEDQLELEILTLAKRAGADSVAELLAPKKALALKGDKKVHRRRQRIQRDI